ncbi:MAG: FGGY-family carbohydrate kinase [Pirellulaceae bacterium]
MGGSVRLLKNIAGLWILQQCREQWKREGHDWSWEQLIAMAEQAASMVSVIDSDAEGFVSPSNMPAAIAEYCHHTGQPVPQSAGEIVRCALESLALRYRLTLSYLEQVVGHPFKTIHMVGVECRTACYASSLPMLVRAPWWLVLSKLPRSAT